ncbi:autophagy-related protein 16-1 isoform X2 [Folsomia candida]|uniref:autophagy-related protein 16-1 isoform X2 n=1 Tax=Folsomia candida TaxID=158441 RepID=UPI000B9025A5|nr:autophagy-related protein 16-1 isoform X2 [Folsomia candida]
MPARQEWRGEFRTQILTRLYDRNKRENRGFTELFQHHERLFENWASIRQENLRLQMEQRGDRRPSSSGLTEEREKALEQKVMGLQEELTEMHRKRGENASQVLSLSAKLTDREAEISEEKEKMGQVQTQLAGCVAKAADLEDQMKFFQAKSQELEATNELLRDEHQALQLAYNSLEEKYLKNLKENSQLVQRYIEIKAQHADLMNQENENFVKKRQAKVQKELEDAAKEVKTVVEVEDASAVTLVPEATPSVPPLGLDYCLVPKTVSYIFDSTEGELYTVRWSPNGKHFLTGGADRKVKLWECTSNGPELRAALTGANASIMSVDFDNSANFMLASSSDYAIRVWTVDDHRLRHTLTGHSQKVLAARFLGSSTKVASGSHDRTLKVWDLSARACISTKFAGSSCNDLVCVDGSSIISGHYDKRIRFWDARTDSPTQEVNLCGRITSLDLSLDKNYLMASVRDDSLAVLDLRMNTIVGQYSAEGFKISSDFDRCCFSPNAVYIACGSSDGSIFVWNVMENKLDSVLKQHSGPVIACHWHPRGVSLLSAEKSKKIVIWTP